MFIRQYEHGTGGKQVAPEPGNKPRISRFDSGPVPLFHGRHDMTIVKRLRRLGLEICDEASNEILRLRKSNSMLHKCDSCQGYVLFLAEGAHRCTCKVEKENVEDMT